MAKHAELESALENRCVAKVEALGGMALKLQIPGVRGFMDRTIFMPGRRIWLAEFKRLRTGTVSAQQHRWRILLHQMGFPVYLIDTDAQFETALKEQT